MLSRSYIVVGDVSPSSDRRQSTFRLSDILTIQCTAVLLSNFLFAWKNVNKRQLLLRGEEKQRITYTHEPNYISSTASSYSGDIWRCISALNVLSPVALNELRDCLLILQNPRQSNILKLNEEAIFRSHLD